MSIVICKHCNGTGVGSMHCPCDFCDGTKVVFTKPVGKLRHVIDDKDRQIALEIIGLAKSIFEWGGTIFDQESFSNLLSEIVEEE